MQRREFLSSALTLAAASLAPRAARAADSLVEILINEPIGEVAAELYGHFTEHIGGVVYDGAVDRELTGKPGFDTPIVGYPFLPPHSHPHSHFPGERFPAPPP